MRGATAPRLLLEVVCARLLLPSASDTEAALLQRVERIETRLDMSIPAGEAAVGAAGVRPAKQFVRGPSVPRRPPNLSRRRRPQRVARGHQTTRHRAPAEVNRPS